MSKDKSPIEKFIKSNGLKLDLEIDEGQTIAMLYKPTDLEIKAFRASTMNEAIQKAVLNFKGKETIYYDENFNF